MDLTALGIVAALLLCASALGLIWKRRQGRVQTGSPGVVIPAHLLAEGSWLTLLQISQPVCSYCQAMRGVLGRVADESEGVAHRDYDVSEVPELIEELGIRQTPTTLLVESSGRVSSRINGPSQPPAISALVAQAREDYLRRTDGYAI